MCCKSDRWKCFSEFCLHNSAVMEMPSVIHVEKVKNWVVPRKLQKHTVQISCYFIRARLTKRLHLCPLLFVTCTFNFYKVDTSCAKRPFSINNHPTPPSIILFTVVTEQRHGTKYRIFLECLRRFLFLFFASLICKSLSCFFFLWFGFEAGDASVLHCIC